MSATQLAVDLAARNSYDAKHYTDQMIGMHLRMEHGWGRRRLARHLRRTEKWVKDNCEQVRE